MKLSEVVTRADVAKYADIRELPKDEQEKLIRRKKLNRRLSQFGGATGVAALATRVPQFARVAGNRSARLRSTKQMAHLTRLEPKATELSNAVGTVAIGSGAINSFNWAKIQQAETKADRARVRKANPLSAMKVIDHIESGTPVPILHTNHDRKERKKRKQGQLVPVNKAALRPVTSPKAVQNYAQTMGRKRKPKLNPMGRYIRTSRGAPMDSRFWDWERYQMAKADDRFLREHRDRISTSAERGYLYLKAGRNRQRRESASAAATSAVAGTAAAHYLGRPVTGTKTKMRVVGGKVLEDKVIIRGARRAPVIAGVAGAAAAASGALAVDRARGAHRWNSKMGKIEARAKQRARDGQWGRDRRPDVAKAVIGDVSKISIRVPRTAIRRGYGVRRGGLMRRGSKTFTRRGSIQGSGRLFR